MPKVGSGSITEETNVESFIKPQRISNSLETIRVHYQWQLEGLMSAINQEIANGGCSVYALNVNGQTPVRDKAQNIKNSISTLCDDLNKSFDLILKAAKDHLKEEHKELIEAIDKKYKELEAKYNEEKAKSEESYDTFCANHGCTQPYRDPETNVQIHAYDYGIYHNYYVEAARQKKVKMDDLEKKKRQADRALSDGNWAKVGTIKVGD